MLEKSFENKVKKFLKEKELWYVKVWGNGVQKAGVPDLLICLKGKFLAVELKNETGEVSQLQKIVIKQINESGGCAIVLRPHDFEKFKELVEKFLRNEGKKCSNQIKF